MSKTIAVGESAYYITESNDRNADWPIWLGAPGTDEAVLFKTQPPNVINCAIVPKAIQGFKRPGPVNDDCAFSWHQDGAFFAFADGSVHFIEETIDMVTYENLGTKNDGNVINDY